MPKETKLQKVAREAEELAAQQIFRESLPARMAAIRVTASNLKIRTEIELDDTGPILSLYLFGSDNFSTADKISYHSEEWEVEYVERRLNEITAERDAEEHRRTVADTVWGKLTNDEKTALKENIKFLR